MHSDYNHPRASWIGKPILQDAVLDRVAARLRAKALPLALRLWNQKTVAGTTPAKVVISLAAPGALRVLAKPSFGSLARAYVHRHIDIEGNIRDIVALLTRYAEVSGRVKKRLGPKWRFWRHHRGRDTRAIRSHYDISNEFYALWLDRRRVYSCAYFKTAHDTLAIAQEQKLDLICRKLRLAPGQRFLDIGCGWGGLIVWAAERYGAKSVGITISRNQFDHVKALIAERGFTACCEVWLMDYRDVPEAEPFDKIASVGMFEHVGVRKLPDYFRTIHRLLKPGGIAMNHGITAATFDDEGIAGIGADFIEQQVFPDGELTHLSKVIEVMSRQGLECLDVESLRPHYARTLWHWVERLEAEVDQVRRLVSEEVYRTWRAYLAGFAYAFEQGWVSVYQILAAKPLEDGSVPYPLARESIYPMSEEPGIRERAHS